MGKLLDNKKLYVESPKTIYINDLTINGEKPRSAVGRVGKNSVVLFESNALVINSATLDTALNCYNVFELNYGAGMQKLKKVVINDLTLDAAATNNIVSLYNFEDNATITFKNCTFNLCDGSNALRVDNLSNAKSVLITFDNCTWKFKSAVAYGKNWDALMIFQDSTHVGVEDVPQFAPLGWKLVVKDCKFGEELITPTTFENYRDLIIANEDVDASKGGKALLYVYKANSTGEKWYNPSIEADKVALPMVRIIANGVKKDFNA